MSIPPPISVVIPARNRAHTLPRSLDSVLAQTCPAAEIIVVDDGSSDSTQEIVEGYRDRGIIYSRLPRGGGAQAARTHGIGLARHEWIAFQDSDDMWLPNKLALQVEALRERQFNSAVAVHGDCIKRDDSTGIELALPVPLTSGTCYKQLLLHPSVMFPGLLVSRNCIAQAGGLDNNCPSYQEWDTAIRLARHCEFVHIREPLFIWYWHTGETISKDIGRDLDGFQYVIEKHRDEIMFHHGIRGWRTVCLQNISRALLHGLFDSAGSMLKKVSPNSSRALAATFVRLGFFPRGGGRLLRYAAMLPL